MKRRKHSGYTNAPSDIAKAMVESIPVENFLPPPEQLILKEDTVKVTLSLTRSSLAKFKRYARKHNGKYQNMIRRLVDMYADKAIA